MSASPTGEQADNSNPAVGAPQPAGKAQAPLPPPPPLRGTPIAAEIALRDRMDKEVRRTSDQLRDEPFRYALEAEDLASAEASTSDRAPTPFTHQIIMNTAFGDAQAGTLIAGSLGMHIDDLLAAPVENFGQVIDIMRAHHRMVVQQDTNLLVQQLNNALNFLTREVAHLHAELADERWLAQLRRAGGRVASLVDPSDTQRETLQKFSDAAVSVLTLPWRGPYRSWNVLTAKLLAAWYTYNAGVPWPFGASTSLPLPTLRRMQYLPTTRDQERASATPLPPSASLSPMGTSAEAGGPGAGGGAAGMVPPGGAAGMAPPKVPSASTPANAAGTPAQATARGATAAAADARTRSRSSAPPRASPPRDAPPRQPQHARDPAPLAAGLQQPDGAARS